MEKKFIQNLIAMLPEGAKKEALLNKLKTLSAGAKKSDGLHDEFAMQPVGHIRLEEIDEKGNVLGVLQDRKNLVVKGSEEILIRAFSGDPKRTLYKNRKIKEYKNENGVTVTKVSKPYNVSLTQLTTVLNGEDVVAHHQNEIWGAVNDEDFEIEYSYYPNHLYVKQEAVSLEPDMLTFKVYTKEGAPVGAAPLQAEVYSNYSNLFIGLGDGENKRIAFNDERLTLVGFTEENNQLVATSVGSKVQFNSKISNFVIKAEGEGTLKITANGQLKETMSLTNVSGGKTVNITGLDAETPTAVSIEMTTGANVKINEIAFDEFSVHDNGLMREFENYTVRFDTPTQYNANAERGPEGTFTIQLNHAPIDESTFVATYNAARLSKANSINELEAGKYFLNADIGRVHLAEPLTAVLVSYNITGEIHEDEPSLALSTANASIVRKTIETKSDITLTNQLDGSKVEFNLNTQRIQEPSNVQVLLDGIRLVEGTGYTLNADTGILTLIPRIIPAVQEELDEDGVTVITPAQPERIVIPSSGNTLVVSSFKYEKHTPAALPSFLMQLEHEVRGTNVRVYDQTGNPLVLVEQEADLVEGKFLVKTNASNKRKTLLVPKQNTAGTLIQKLEVFYKSDEMPGEPTNYKRQVIDKPKAQSVYPWFSLDKGQVVFVAEFPEKSPTHNVTIREMGLFDGPRTDDGVRGFSNYNVKAFSLVRIGETRKEATTGLRLTWTITLMNEDDQPFRGGL